MRLCVSSAIVLMTTFLLPSLMTTRAFPMSGEYGSSRMRTKRGFREGSADRISHGFGKRSSPSSSSSSVIDLLTSAAVDTPDFVMTDDDLANYIHRDRRVADRFVRSYVDLNDDGIITEDELI